MSWHTQSTCKFRLQAFADYKTMLFDHHENLTYKQTCWLSLSSSVNVYDGDKWCPILCIKDRSFRWFQIAILSSVRGSEPSTNKRRRLHICDISLINGRMHLKKDRSSFSFPVLYAILKSFHQNERWSERNGRICCIDSIGQPLQFTKRCAAGLAAGDGLHWWDHYSL